MSRAYLLAVSQRKNTYELYIKFKKKSPEHRETIREFLRCLHRINIHVPKDIWNIVFNYLPCTSLKNLNQIIDIPPKWINREQYIDLLSSTLICPVKCARNPLLYTDNIDESIYSGQIVKYGLQEYLCYPSMYVQKFYSKTTDGTTYECSLRGELFLGILEEIGEFPLDGSAVVGGVRVTQGVRIPLLKDYTSKPIKKPTLLYLPEVGIRCENEDTKQIKVTIPKKRHQIQFSFAFTGCSSTLKTIFTKKRTRYH